MTGAGKDKVRVVEEGPGDDALNALMRRRELGFEGLRLVTFAVPMIRLEFRVPGLTCPLT